MYLILIKFHNNFRFNVYGDRGNKATEWRGLWVTPGEARGAEPGGWMKPIV